MLATFTCIVTSGRRLLGKCLTVKRARKCYRNAVAVKKDTTVMSV